MKMQEVKKALPEIISSHCGVISHSTTNRKVSYAHELVHKNTCNTQILNKSLEVTRFFEKK